MIAYKLFKVRKDGSLGSLFINRKRKLPTKEWLASEPFPTKGYTFRPMWHCTRNPVAPHLSLKGREWFKVEIEDYLIMERPKSQGGIWYLAKDIKILEKI